MSAGYAGLDTNPRRCAAVQVQSVPDSKQESRPRWGRLFVW